MRLPGWVPMWRPGPLRCGYGKRFGCRRLALDKCQRHSPLRAADVLPPGSVLSGAPIGTPACEVTSADGLRCILYAGHYPATQHRFFVGGAL